ncbi:MAG: hypothetical protein IJJ00_04465 [Erysipelotrichaceae bacterium]|nr:hypothetical protein [Erysipelotrichaceae bacterium]
MKIYEDFIRSHLSEELSDAPIDYFSGEYLDGLKVMCEGERGGPDTVVYEAKDEEDLCWWQLERVCHYIDDKKPYEEKTWRWYRDHAEDGQWRYIEHRNYDYNAIEDARLKGFERFLRNCSRCLPEDRFEERIEKYTGLMNRWYKIPHWDYDRERLCFIEISDSREYAADNDDTEEPRPGSVIRTVE